MPRLISFSPFNNAKAIWPSFTPTTCGRLVSLSTFVHCSVVETQTYRLTLCHYESISTKNKKTSQVFPHVLLYENKVSTGIPYAFSSAPNPSFCVTRNPLGFIHSHSPLINTLGQLPFPQPLQLHSKPPSYGDPPWSDADGWIVFDRRCVAFCFGWIL